MIVNALRSLSAHPDVLGVLDRLRGARHRLIALANSPLSTVHAQLEHTHLADRFERIFSADRPAR